MKIGILGGSFDPIHKAHIYMAKAARKAMQLDQVWLIPAGHSPNKDEGRMTSAADRLEMVRIAVSGDDSLWACDEEVVSQERSYTYRTLEKLTAAYPMHEFYFIMGGDSLDYFDSWKHPEIIAQLSVILVLVREDFEEEAMQEKIRQMQSLFPCDIRLIPAPRYDLSSTEIRRRIREEDFCRKHLPEGVYAYIREHGLYAINK